MKKMFFTIGALIVSSIVMPQKAERFGNQFADNTERKAVFDFISHPAKILPEKNEATIKYVSGNQAFIGGTVYDLQTTGIIGNRVFLFDDGTVGAVWTMGMESPQFPDKGTGYNYFDGSSWSVQPYLTIESARAENPSYTAWGTNGEAIASHSCDQGTLVLNMCDEKGTGDWQEITYTSPVNCNVGWPKITTSGINHNIIHLLYLAAECTQSKEQGNRLFYSRSEDDGTTWTDVILEGTGSDYYNSIYPDSYVWAAPGNGVIAFLCTSSWYDLFFMKSEDNGETWQKTVVWEHPYPFFDWDSTLFDEVVWAPDNSGDIAVDNNGMVHIVFGLTRVKHPEPGNSFVFFPITDGIVYWNENMPPFTAENQSEALSYDNLVTDSTLIGWVQGNIPSDSIVSYRELGMSTMPEISIRESNNQVIVAWSSPAFGYGNGNVILRHIYLRSSPDGGNSWSNFCDINEEISNFLDECIYPVMSESIDDQIRLIYQTDMYPGTAVDGDHDWSDNTIIYYSANADEIFTGTNGNISEPGIKVSQNYPNPFKKTTVINVTLKEKAGLSLLITDITGKQIKLINKGEVNAGMHGFTIDATELSKGVYYYTVKAGENSITKKMVVM
jgi:hypothetical protein